MQKKNKKKKKKKKKKTTQLPQLNDICSLNQKLFLQSIFFPQPMNIACLSSPSEWLRFTSSKKKKSKQENYSLEV